MSSELRNVRVLSGLSDSQLEQLLAYGEFVEFAAGHEIIKQGQKADGIYFLIQGKAASYVTDKDRAQTPLSTSEAGAHFGEVAVLHHGTRTASVRASVKCRVFRISLESFESLLKSPDLALPLVLALAKSMAVRMGAVTDRLADARSLKNAWL
jgi:CRP-like cAMP-binding protein